MLHWLCFFIDCTELRRLRLDRLPNDEENESKYNRQSVPLQPMNPSQRPVFEPYGRALATEPTNPTQRAATDAIKSPLSLASTYCPPEYDARFSHIPLQ